MLNLVFLGCWRAVSAGANKDHQRDRGGRGAGGGLAHPHHHRGEGESVKRGECEEGGIVSGETGLVGLIGFFFAFEFES